MNLGLRNWLAERCLEALTRDGTERPGGSRHAEDSLSALASFAERADERGSASGLSDEQRQTLEAWPKLFERERGTLRLTPALIADLPALRWRAGRFLEAFMVCQSNCGSPPRASNGMPPSVGEIAWTLCAAAALFNAGLFFEVHELLEPSWIRAEGPLRQFLQGLIQVAAGLHHEQNGNPRGAISLLAEGGRKLHPFAPRFFGVELGEFLPRLADLARTLSVTEGASELSVPPLVLRPDPD